MVPKKIWPFYSIVWSATILVKVHPTFTLWHYPIGNSQLCLQSFHFTNPQKRLLTRSRLQPVTGCPENFCSLSVWKWSPLAPLNYYLLFTSPVLFVSMRLLHNWWLGSINVLVSIIIWWTHHVSFSYSGSSGGDQS